ncbi:SMI1/KNR4 family protein [Planomicrobium chinense]|uniref:SMI1/KNR4 family protein n=1 Tax=Planococcus chinensis TaxID=272917 RepID=UPI001CC7A323|nr:SMI1/KNR4 family protein [Planococcus chinensis]MBZ5202689.1 SMI1/KNR4 family protein [Planococcus chinensis]
MHEHGWNLLFFKEAALLFSDHYGIQLDADVPNPFQGGYENIAQKEEIELIHPMTKQPYSFQLHEYAYGNKVLRYAIAEMMENGLNYQCVWQKAESLEPVNSQKEGEETAGLIELDHRFGIYHSVPGMKEFLACYQDKPFLELWQEYHEFLKAKFGDSAVPLLPGNASEDIEAVFQLCGAEPVEDFVSLYRYCDGNDLDLWMEFVEAGLPVYAHITGYPLMNLREIRLEAEEAVREAISREEVQSIPEGFVKDNFMLAQKIPIYHDGGGNFIAIDLDPDTKGHYGQIVEVDHEYEDRLVLANSLKEYIAILYYFVKELGVIYNGEGFEGEKPISAYIVRSE